MPKLTKTGGLSKVDIPMAPMIDIVFQLLIFFMLNLKIVAPEGNFNVNMPIKAPSETPPDEPIVPDIKVKLQADANGNLVQLLLGDNPLGNDDRRSRGPRPRHRRDDDRLPDSTLAAYPRLTVVQRLARRAFAEDPES